MSYSQIIEVIFIYIYRKVNVSVGALKYKYTHRRCIMRVFFNIFTPMFVSVSMKYPDQF